MKNKFTPIIVLIGGSCYMFVIGCVYLWGSISLYITSYFRINGWDIHESSLVFQLVIRSVFIIILPPVSSYLLIKHGIKIIVALGGILFTLFCFLSSLTSNPNLFVFYFGAAFGISTGLGYTTLIACVLKHFEVKGRATGILVSMFGFGSSFFAPISRWIANPNNIIPDMEVTHGKLLEKYYRSNVALEAPTMIRWLCLIWFILMLISYLLVKDKENIKNESNKEQVNLDKEAKNEKTEKLISEIGVIKNEFPDLISALKSKQFWILLFLFLEILYLDYFLAFAYKTIGILFNYDDAFLTWIGFFRAICDGLSRIFWGFLADRFKFKSLYTITLVSKVT